MKQIFTGALAAIGLLATTISVSAEVKPWQGPMPAGLDEKHKVFASEAKQVLDQIPADQFGYDPLQAEWDYQGDRLPKTPLSNMTVPSLSKLFTGRYNVYTNADEPRWSVRYYAPDGKTYFCGAHPSGSYVEWVYDRYIYTTAFGLGGIMHWDPDRERTRKPRGDDAVGWPTVTNADTGEVVMYGWNDTGWFRSPGWLQNEYAAAFAEHCPSLPRVSVVNNNQLGDTLQDLAQNAKPIRGFRTAFRNDPRDPLTAGMFYYLYPPRQ